MKTKKSLGQNFLMHAATAERIADASGIGKTDTVLEIGPGTGMLTRALLARAKKVIAVETDRELVETLRETFAAEIEKGALELIAGDIRALDRARLPRAYHLVANIPYYLTGDIIRTFLSGAHLPASMTLLVQKEVAVRIARSKKESILSVAVKTFGTPRLQFLVPRGAFVPAPNVDSAVISITNIKSPFSSTASEKHFFDVLHAGFAHKRKFLASNLRDSAAKKALGEAFRAAKLPPTIRAEEVLPPLWHVLAKYSKNKHT